MTIEIKLDGLDDSSKLKHLKLSTNYLSEGIAVYALDTESSNVRLVFISDTARRLLGIQKELNLPCNLASLGLLSDDKERYEGKLKEAFVSHQGFVMTQHLKSQGLNVERYREVRVLPKVGNTPSETLLVELSRDTTLSSSASNELTKANLRLSLSLEQGSQRIWELDLVTKTLSFFDPTQGALGALTHSLHIPEKMYAKSFVHPESQAAFNVFVKKLLGGEKAGGGAFMLRSLNSQGYSWYAVSFRMLYGQDGLPQRAIGLVSNLDPASHNPKMLVYSEIWHSILANLFGYVKINLSQSKICKLWALGKELSATVNPISYKEFLVVTCKKIFSHEFREYILEFLQKDTLLKRYEEGYVWSYINTDFVEHSAYIRSVSIQILLTKEESTNDIYAFLFLQFNEKMKALGAEIYQKAERDPKNGAYTQESAKRFIVHCLKHPHYEHAHALVRICHLEYKKGLDKPIPQNAFSFIVGAFALYFETCAIVSAYDENSISIFIPHCKSIIEARELLENAFIFVRKIVTSEKIEAVRFVAALCQGLLKEEFVDNFFENATCLCSRLELRAVDTIEYLLTNSQVLAQKNQSLLFASNFENLQFKAQKENHALSDLEKILLHEIMDLIIKNNSPTVALTQIFSLLGRYYQADRVYTIRVLDDLSYLEEICEWDNGQKASFKGLISGVSLERFPLLKRVFTSQKATFIERIARAMNLQRPENTNDNAKHAETWSYAAIPFTFSASDNTFSGVLCIDNPQNYQGRLVLPEALKDYLGILHQKLLKERLDFVNVRDFAAGIYGLKAYREQIGFINSDTYSSLGVLVLAVPKLLTLANEYGIDHCTNLIAYEAEILQISFGNSFIFHTYDQEYVVVVPNMTKQIFFDRVSTVKQLCMRNFPSQISSGATWSRGVFSAQHLIKEARTIMLSQQMSNTNVKLSTYEVNNNSFNPTTSALLKRFTVFFQPKIDMNTKKVIGAEALVRGIDENGQIIPPMRFISAMEKDGTLRDLDLFVFSRVLWQLQTWKAQGLKIVPVSVNFSRYTVFDNSTAGAILAILSHYDKSIYSLMEIELTETACSIEDATLNRTLDTYRNLGLKIALDDFGTGYANLSIFSKVRFDTVKLDRSLINDLSVNAISRSLLESITKISAQRHIAVVAEGVEYEEQVEILKASGCYIAQGFLYDRPIDVADFTQRYLKTEAKIA